MKGIVRVTEKMYILDQLVKAQDISQVDNILDEHLSLFERSNKPISIVALNQLKRGCEYDLINQSYESIWSRIKNGEKILNKL